MKPKLMERRPIYVTVVAKLMALVRTFDDDMGAL